METQQWLFFWFDRGLVKDNHPVAQPRAACNLFLSLIAQIKASEQQKSPQKIKKSTVSSTEQKHKERDRERERESPVVCSVPWSITFIWADRAAVYWTKSWLKPPSPSNKPKSSSRISASLCVPSCCCGNVLLLLLSLYWSGCNCSKTLFGGASSFHGVGGILGFLKHLKPQATVFPRDIKAPDWFSAWYHLLEHNDFWKVSLSTCIQYEWTIEHTQSVLWNQLQG